jgi:hypothetical protein
MKSFGHDPVPERRRTEIRVATMLADQHQAL